MSTLSRFSTRSSLLSAARDSAPSRCRLPPKLSTLAVGCDYCGEPRAAARRAGRARVLVLRALLQHLVAARDALQRPVKFGSKGIRALTQYRFR
jgi:hypothetical protein